MSSPTLRVRRPAASVLLAVTALCGTLSLHAAPAVAQTPAAAAIDVSHPAAQALPGFADLVQKVTPAVVTISSTVHEHAEDQEGSPFPPGSPQDRMFNQFFSRRHPNPAQLVHALGSGFIVDAQGLIVTNDHVVKDATDIQVTLADGRKMAAKVVGVDAKTDLAVLQVKSATPLPHLALGDSDAVRVGDWVVAVGNPFGLGGTVTAGILSARGRQIGQGPYDDFLQIDAPINRGNSGGPLFAQDGTVIGVNTAIYSPSGGSVGIGFAIPSRVVKQVVAQLEGSGHVDRGYLGVSAQPVSPAMARALHASGTAGALVAEVQKDSPAEAAGVQAGDIIEKVGGQPVLDPRGLARIVADVRSGTKQDILVWRDGAEKTIAATIAALPDGQAAKPAEAAAAAEADGDAAKLGLDLAPLDRLTREGLSLPAGQKGVLVAGVTPGSPAEAAGMQVGDIIESVGGQAVGNPQAARKALHDGTAAAGSSVALRVLHDGHQGFVALGNASGQE